MSSMNPNSVITLDISRASRVSVASAQKAIQQPGVKSKGVIFANRTRYLILTLSIVCLTLVMANSLSFNFTVICMVKDADNTTDHGNREPSNNESNTIALYDDNEKGLLFSSVAIGTIYVFVLRMIQGLSVASSYPAMGIIATEWAPFKRTGTFIAYLSTHLQLSVVILMPLGGELCESSYGWPTLYYLLAGTTLVFFTMFFCFYRDSPAIHRNVSHRELTLLQEGKVVRVLDRTEQPKVPYRAIFTDTAVLGIVASCIGGSLGFQLFFQYGPIYLNKILKFNVQSTGFAAALPAFLAMLLKFVVGPLSDIVPYLDDRWRVILFASISQFSMATCFLVLAFLPANSQFLSSFFYTLCIMSSALNAIGVQKGMQLISGRFSYLLFGVNQFAVGNRWTRLLVFTAILVFITTMMFNLTAEGTPRAWAREIPIQTVTDVQTLSQQRQQAPQPIFRPCSIDDGRFEFLDRSRTNFTKQ
ncbi:hypothetical protein M3Y98_00997400 [Aphelenchoides besseyi]|nr:hypothetical protein M3Y98_00997400 [Aphelenchoides besseyi]